MSTILKTGPAPHIRTAETVESVMYDVVIALIPAFAMAVYTFGIRAFILTVVAVLTCIVTEYICQKALKRDIEAFDGSAILTGILFSFVVPVIMPLQYVVVGCVVAIALGKMVYGGLGHNIFNPALIGRAFVQASWPVAITTFAYDGKGGPTVLSAMKFGKPLTDALIEGGNPHIQAFLGQMGGSLGETSALALLVGGIYLIYKKHIDWKVPAVMIGTVFVLTWALGAEDPLMQILSGGLFLGAKMENRYIHFGIVLGLIAAISAGILGSVNGFTSKVIAENALKIVNEARVEVLPSASTFKEEEAKEVDGIQYIPGYDESGAVVGYVASVAQPGYAGDINFVVGIDNDAKITGLNVISQSETPGLGAKVTGKKWQQQWIGRDDSYKFDKAVDAFAGATISPRAVYTGIMRALENYKAEVSQ